jgi:hypothetical protein
MDSLSNSILTLTANDVKPPKTQKKKSLALPGKQKQESRRVSVASQSHFE